MKMKGWLATGYTILITALFYSGWSRNTDNIADNTLIPGDINTTVYAARVIIKNSAFDPYELLIGETGSVLWLNGDNTVHTVTADNGAFDSGDIQAGGNSFLLSEREDCTRIIASIILKWLEW